MSALKPKKFSSDEEQQEKIQYVVVEHSSQIKKILKAEKETPAIQTPQLPVATAVAEQKIKTQQKTSKTRQFIKDDRHREYPKFKEDDKKQTKQKYEPKQENNKQQKNEKIEQGSKEGVQRKNQRQQYREHEYQSQKEQKNQGGKKKFIEKSQINNSKDEKYDETQKYNKKKENFNQKQKKSTVRQQYQYINGEQITIQLIENRPEHENVIFIGEKLAKDYVKIAKKLISQEDTIVIKAFGLFVSKAFLVAGLLADITPGLKQINNPSTVSVYQISKKSEIKTKRGMIEIELSLNNLNKNHFGYQKSQQLQPEQTTSKSYKAQDRPQERKAYKQKEEIDERELR